MAKASEEKKEYARALYMLGEQQNAIAEKTGISKQTVSKWVADGGWAEIRTAQRVTRPEIVNNLLRALQSEVDRLHAETDPKMISGAADKLSKIAATIEKLDKQVSVVDAIEVFMAFGKWINHRKRTDRELTPELVKAINRYQDIYITEQISGKL